MMGYDFHMRHYTGSVGTAQEHITVEGIDIELIRKRVRSINLHVRPDGSVWVSAGPHVPLERIEAFVASKRVWIERSRRRTEASGERQRLVCAQGAEVVVWGASLTCEVRSRASRSERPTCRFRSEGDTLLVEADARVCGEDEADVAARTEALRAFLAAEMREAACRALPAAEALVGRRASKLRFRKMKTRWGSCNVQTGAITLNTLLVHYEPRCLRYVLVHELCHLHEPSHNARFHALMDQFMPDWRDARALLNGRA